VGSQDENDKIARRSLELLSAIFDLLPVGIRLRSKNGALLLFNETATAQFPAAQNIPASAFEAPATTQDRLIGSAGERTLLTLHRPVEILHQPLLLSASVDVTEQKRIETELAQRAYFDELTSLPNSHLVRRHVESLLQGTRSRSFALVFLDLDNFRHINDYYGHEIGDGLLVKVAQRVQSRLRKSDMIGRAGGDQFLLVLELGPEDDLGSLVESLSKELKEPVFADGFEILTSASMGVSVYPVHGESYEALRRTAETAMHRVKAETKGAVAVFSPDFARDLSARSSQEQRLRLAIRDGRFCCVFQPKVDLRSEEVVGLEALIRLRDERGLIEEPSASVALAIELGLIDDLTRLALAEILRSMERIDEVFGPKVPISINVAAKQAGDIEFMTAFCDELVASKRLNRLMLEVTEDALLATNQFQRKVLPLLRELGIPVSIDDFGTGFSSLAMLADITVDELKIDRAFITDIHRRPRSQSILRAIEGLGEALGMTVVAEGVETFEELAYLQAATRIRYGQGYYFSKPVLLEEMTSRRVVEDSRRLETARKGTTPRAQQVR
jgi:diguanylate cyclase (GGDEF)-like protein